MTVKRSLSRLTVAPCATLMTDIILAIICTPIMFVAFLLWMACVMAVIDAAASYCQGESRGIKRMLKRWHR